MTVKRANGQCTGGWERFIQLGQPGVSPRLRRTHLLSKEQLIASSTHRGSTISMSQHLLNTGLLRIRALTDNRIERAAQVTDDDNNKKK